MKSALLTHGGRVKHICVSELTIFGSDKGLSPGRSQAIVWTNAGILLIGPLETNVSENFIAIYTFSFKTMQLKMSSAKWGPFCPGLNAWNVDEVLLRRWQKRWFTSVQPHESAFATVQNILNSSTPGQHDRRFADDIFRWIFINEKFDFHWNSSLTITQHCFR